MAEITLNESRRNIPLMRSLNRGERKRKAKQVEEHKSPTKILGGWPKIESFFSLVLRWCSNFVSHTADDTATTLNPTRLSL